MLNFPIVQIAYFVNDARVAAVHMASRYGAGPFFLAEKIELSWGEHRGKSQKFLHTSAYGQWGNMMIELVQQDEEGPSPFRDMYQPGEEGIHHVAMMVDSMRACYDYCQSERIEIAARASTMTGTEFAFVDTVAAMGHMTEIYEKTDQLMGFYDMVRRASVNWDGGEVVRSLG